MSKISKSFSGESAAPGIPFSQSVIIKGDSPKVLRENALALSAAWMGEAEKVKSGVHVDLYILDNGPDDNILIGQIRHIIKDTLLRPFDGETKVYIIAHSQNLSTAAQNALLRVLEEPPPYVKFILTVSNIDLLLPTIISRCEIIRTLSGDELLIPEEANQFIGILGDPWKRMEFCYSLEKRTRPEMRKILIGIIALLRDAIAAGDNNPAYLPEIQKVAKLIPSLELNASVGSICGILAISN